MATGDLNGDGYADLAIGIPGYPVDGFGEFDGSKPIAVDAIGHRAPLSHEQRSAGHR